MSKIVMFVAVMLAIGMTDAGRKSISTVCFKMGKMRVEYKIDHRTAAQKEEAQGLILTKVKEPILKENQEPLLKEGQESILADTTTSEASAPSSLVKWEVPSTARSNEDSSAEKGAAEKDGKESAETGNKGESSEEECGDDAFSSEEVGGRSSEEKNEIPLPASKV